MMSAIFYLTTLLDKFILLSEIVKYPTCHTFRHSGVYPVLCGTIHLLENGYDIRTLQELLGHKPA